MEKPFGTTRKTLRPDLAMAAAVGAAMAFAGGQAQAFPPQDPPCPTSVLAPSGLDPKPVNKPHCPTTPNCLVTFKGYQWWTAYPFTSADGFYNDGLRTSFAPEHAFIGGDGNLHLKANNDIDLGDPGNTHPWSGGEAVLMFNGDGTEANLGYGTYLVTAQLVGGSWAALDPNMALGLFKYERPATGPELNTVREIDLAEISRWGWNHTGTCPIGGKNFNFPNNILCKGNAQFALQQIMNANAGQAPKMVDRYDIGDNDVVTLVMKWHQGPEGREVEFKKYKGARSLSDLPAVPDYPWKTDPDTTPTPPDFKTNVPPAVKEFIPHHTATSCERFHINFWFGHYIDDKRPNPPPASPQEVIITNFEFSPAK
ncbi:MAG: hypothetical protein ACREDM_01810 [Methylocella sp.]